MKRLVICCDGTWNAPDAEGGPTNVAKIATQVASRGRGVEQRVYYDAGVGTGGWADQWLGGATGYGLSRNVRDAYRWLARSFAEGDEIFLVGFSRGAYTVRSLAGLMRNCGVLRPEHADRVDEAYRLYRSRLDEHHPTGRRAALFRRTFAVETPIRFVGVFDTVGALGVPFAPGPLARRVAFHDTELSSWVGSASQALAIDERRGPFVPALWTRADPGQDVAQVWFDGVHSDVGGGYADPDLAEISLLWMVERARAQGLVVAPGAFGRALDGSTTLQRRDGARVRPSALGRRHDSCQGIYRRLPEHLRGFDATRGVAQSVASSVGPLLARQEPPRGGDRGFDAAPRSAVVCERDAWGLRVGETVRSTTTLGGRRRGTGVVVAGGGLYDLGPTAVDGWRLEHEGTGIGDGPWPAPSDGELVWRSRRAWGAGRGPTVDLRVTRLERSV